MKQLHTEIDIQASPATVWDVLTDLSSHAEWDPFMVEASGTVAEGERLRIRMEPPGGRAATFKPTVTVVEPSATFEWLGRVGMPGLFDGRHRFELHATATGTRLVQTEKFTGVLVPLFGGSLDTATLSGFEAMNTALKDRAEGLASGDGS
jgi:hypothetical protein